MLEQNVRQLQEFDVDKKGVFERTQSSSFRNDWLHIDPGDTVFPLWEHCTLLLMLASMMSRAGIISEWFLETDRKLTAVSTYQGLPPRCVVNNCVTLSSHQHPSVNHVHDYLNQAE